MSLGNCRTLERSRLALLTTCASPPRRLAPGHATDEMGQRRVRDTPFAHEVLPGVMRAKHRRLGVGRFADRQRTGARRVACRRECLACAGETPVD